MSTLHEQPASSLETVALPMAEQNIKRGIKLQIELNPDNANMDPEAMKANVEAYTQAVFELSEFPEFGDALPTTKNLVSYASRKETIRDEVGVAAYDLVRDKLNEDILANHSEVYDNANKDWLGTVGGFVALIKKEGAAETEEATLFEDLKQKRAKAIEAYRGLIEGALTRLSADTEVQKFFAGHEQGLQRLIDMHRSEIEENVDLNWLTQFIAESVKATQEESEEK